MIVAASNLITKGLEVGIIASVVTVNINDAFLSELVSQLEHL
jgi:hypothetical protein